VLRSFSLLLTLLFALAPLGHYANNHRVIESLASLHAGSACPGHTGGARHDAGDCPCPAHHGGDHSHRLCGQCHCPVQPGHGVFSVALLAATTRCNRSVTAARGFLPQRVTGRTATGISPPAEFV